MRSVRSCPYPNRNKLRRRVRQKNIAMLSALFKIKKTKIASIAATAAAILLMVFLVEGLDLPYNRRVPILMYHNIVKDGENTDTVSISESRFEADLIYMQEHGYVSVLPREIGAPGFSWPEKPVIISFDDGYRSNCEIAYPLLKKYGFKAEFSVITAPVDSGHSFFCSWDMLREMNDSGIIEIGSHTHNCHNPEYFGALSDDGINGVQRKKGESDEDFNARVLEDIKLSCMRIADELGTPPSTFSYPFGSNDPDADRLVRELFRFSFNTRAGYYRTGRGSHKLPRYGIREETDISRILR